MSTISPAVRSKSSGPVILAAIAQMLVGLVCATALLASVQIAGASPDSVPDASSHWITDAFFPAGMALGLLLSDRLLARIPANFVFGGSLFLALSLNAGYLQQPAFLTACLLRLAAGVAIGVVWVAAELALNSCVVNFRRWRAHGIVIAGFMSFAVCVSGVWVLESLLPGLVSATPAVSLQTAVYHLSVAGLLIAPCLILVFPPTRLSSETPKSAPAVPKDCQTGSDCISCTAPMADHCSEHQHDHDHDHGNDQNSGEIPAAESCGVEDCCGGITKSAKTAPAWIGLSLAAAGLVLFFGPLMQLMQQAVAGRQSGPAALIAIGIAMISGVGVYRLGVSQAGNALTLPVFLVAACISSIAAGLFADSTPLATGSLLLAAFAVAGCFHGSLAMVTEYFGDLCQRFTRNRLLAGGAAAAAVLLGLTGFLAEALASETARTVVWLTVTIGCSAVCVVALRAIPQPIVVTRFAERFLKTSKGRTT